MSLQDDIEYLGLVECEFNDSCDYCDDPQGDKSLVSMSVGEGYSEAAFYICKKCLPAEAKKMRETNAEFKKAMEEQYEIDKLVEARDILDNQMIEQEDRLLYPPQEDE